MDALLQKDFSEKSLGRAILLYFFLTVTDERNCSIQFIDRSLDCFFGKKKKQRRKEFTEYKFVDTVRDCFGVLGINSWMGAKSAAKK